MRRRVDQARKRGRRGFSVLELMIVVAILLVVAAFAVPNLMMAAHTVRLRGAGTDFAALLQQARMRAVQDDRYYSVYRLVNGTLQQEFVDIYPQAVNGASGSNGQTLDPRDPVISFPNEVHQRRQALAPDTQTLQTQFLGNNAGGVVPLDGRVSPVTFGPEGIPCVPKIVFGGTVCNSTVVGGIGGLTAYWVFLQDTITQKWEAITVTPAGRIQKWYYTGAFWAKI